MGKRKSPAYPGASLAAADSAAVVAAIQTGGKLLSTTDDAPATVTQTIALIADPAPLGLAAFALTTFLLSVINAGWAKSSTGSDWLGYAFAYGGLVQLLAGMWEFKNRNVFGSTAFSSYGAFWIGLGLWAVLVAPHALSAGAANKDLGWILLAFAIFNTYMLIFSTQVNAAIFAVFLTLELTEIFLAIGGLAGNANITKIGGIIGIITAAAAWYASAAGVINGMKGGIVLPVGRPLLSLKAQSVLVP
jgi:succinate-acetate transporter protein